MKLQARIGPLLLGLCLGLGMLPLTVASLVYLRQFETELTTAAVHRLDAVADKKADQIAGYLRERIGDVRLAGASMLTRSVLTEPHHDDAKFAAYGAGFARYAEIKGFYDVLLIDAAGQVMYSLAREADYRTNLHSGPWRGTELARSYGQALKSEDVVVSRALPYMPSGDKPAIFLLQAVREGGTLLGVLAVQLDIGRTLATATDVTGLGASGETLLAQRIGGHILFNSPVRGVEERAFAHRVVETKTTPALRAALAGERGSGADVNALGRPVIAAWRAIPELEWGMVVQMDADEVLAPMHRWRRIAIGVLTLLLGLSLLATWLLWRALVRPLRRLTHASAQIADGDLLQRAPLSGPLEMQQLALSFDRMAEHLSVERQMLESRVAERTAELAGALAESEATHRTLALSERQYQALFDCAPQAMLQTDDRGDIVLVNQEAQRLLAYRAEQLLGQSIVFLAPAEYREAYAGLNRAFLANPGVRPPGVGAERHVQTGDGRRLIVDLSVHPVEGPSGQQFVICLIDVSEQREIERQLRLAKEAAETAAKLKSSFLANMSHEIRTPLNAMIGLTEIVLESELDARQRDYLDKARAASQTLLRILNDVLDYSKIEAGMFRLQEREFALADVLGSTGKLFADQAARKGLRLDIGADADVPARLIGDPLRLGQILNNLIGNAIKFTERGAVGARMRLLGSDGGRVHLLLTVQDSGLGMSEQQCAHLFQPFTQVDASASRQHGGTGLGLSIARQLARMMGGDIAVSSVPGEGSRFECRLWLDRAEVGAGETAPIAAVPDYRRLAAPLQGMRVLVVDDNEVNRQVAREILLRAGLAVTTVGSGTAALDALAAFKFSAVLMDVQMPDMDGLEAARRIRQMPHGAAQVIIAVTANALVEDRRACLDAGMNDHIGKPYEPRQLVEKLLRWLCPGAAAAAGTPAAETASDVDWPTLRARLAALATCLDENRLTALGQNRELAQALAATPWATRFAAIDSEIRAMRFAGARAQIIELLASPEGGKND